MFASDPTDSELKEGDKVLLNCTVRLYGNARPNVTLELIDESGRNLTSEVHSLLNNSVSVQQRVIVTSSPSRSFYCKITATIVNMEIVSKTFNVTLNHVVGEFFEHHLIMSLRPVIGLYGGCLYWSCKLKYTGWAKKWGHLEFFK